jgi:hypothetical protein
LRCGLRDFRHGERRIVRGDCPAPQVDDAGRRVEQPGIPIPDVGRCRMTSIGARKPLDCKRFSDPTALTA